MGKIVRRFFDVTLHRVATWQEFGKRRLEACDAAMAVEIAQADAYVTAPPQISMAFDCATTWQATSAVEVVKTASAVPKFPCLMSDNAIDGLFYVLLQFNGLLYVCGARQTATEAHALADTYATRYALSDAFVTKSRNVQVWGDQNALERDFLAVPAADRRQMYARLKRQ